MASGTGVRDFTDYSNQPWPGKILPLTFNNVADAGDGFPGVQYAMRIWTKDYLHSGGMETGFDMSSQAIWASDITGNLGYISGFEMISANTGQFAHLSGFSTIGMGSDLDFQDTYNISGIVQLTGSLIRVDTTNGLTVGSNTPSSAQWGYVSAMNQGVATTDSPTFVGLNLSANLVTSSTIDSVDIQSLNSAYAGHAAAGNPHSNSSAVHGHPYASSTHANEAHNPDYSATSHTHTDSTLTFTLDNAFDDGKIINGATSSANGFKFGGPSDYINAYAVSNAMFLSCVGTSLGFVIMNTANDELVFGTNNNYRWTIEADGTFRPEGSNNFDIGDGSNEVASLWYCTPQDVTCADLSHYPYEELYGLYEQIKPMSDGGLHLSKESNQVFPHIDFKTLPKEFATPTKEEITKNNVWEYDEEGEVVTRDVEYKVGDTIAIDAGTYLYGLSNLVVKMGEKIKTLEGEIALLKNA